MKPVPAGKHRDQINQRVPDTPGNKSAPAESDPPASARHQAEQAALRQLVGALIAEGLLQRTAPATPDTHEDRQSYHLGDSPWRLEVAGTRENLGLFRHFERVTLATPAGAFRALQHPRDLLSALAEAGVISSTAARRLGDEISESITNDAACRHYRSQRDARIRATLRRRDKSFWTWLTRDANRGNPELFLEQWSAVGHPYHVMKKSRQGLPLDVVKANAPEFGARVPMTLLAVRRERLHLESAAGQERYTAYMAHHFPEWLQRWSDALNKRGLDAGDFIPVPAHPLQVEHVLPRCAADPGRYGVVVLEDLQLGARPTTSFRTLVPCASPRLPHLKTAVGVRMTTVPRTISPRSCEMGPRISSLLEDVIARHPVLSACLSVVPELYGMHFQSSGGEDEALESNVAAIIRENPARHAAAGEWLVPATAFSVPAPGSGLPFLVDILASQGDASLAGARRCFRHYAEILLTGLLTLYLEHGIALEAHQQNMFAVLRGDGEVMRFVARDFGGIRIHRPTLEAQGLRLELHADRLTVREDQATVRKKLLTPTYHYHLGEIAATLGHHYGCGDGPFWDDLAEITAAIFDALHGRVKPAHWHTERAAILDADWDLKATLRMRLAGADGDCYTRYANPLNGQGRTSGLQEPVDGQAR